MSRALLLRARGNRGSKGISPLFTFFGSDVLVDEFVRLLKLCVSAQTRELAFFVETQRNEQTNHIRLSLSVDELKNNYPLSRPPATALPKGEPLYFNSFIRAYKRSPQVFDAFFFASTRRKENIPRKLGCKNFQFLSFAKKKRRFQGLRPCWF